MDIIKKSFTFMIVFDRIAFVSSTDDRAYLYRKILGEESPSFIGQGAG